jgi:hypothetical protein
MADTALFFCFKLAADVMQQCRSTEYIKPGIHQPADMQYRLMDPLGMVRSMTAAQPVMVWGSHATKPLCQLFAKGTVVCFNTI